jgi:hypothetical protein
LYFSTVGHRILNRRVIFMNKQLKLKRPPLQILPPVVVWRLRAVPVKQEGDVITILMDDPTDLDSIDTLHHLVGGRNPQLDILPVGSDVLERVMRQHFAEGEMEGCRRRRAVAELYLEYDPE